MKTLIYNYLSLSKLLHIENRQDKIKSQRDNDVQLLYSTGIICFIYKYSISDSVDQHIRAENIIHNANWFNLIT